MNHLTNTEKYIIPTSGGVYHSITSYSNKKRMDLPGFIRNILSYKQSPRIDSSDMEQWTKGSDIAQLALDNNWVTLEDQPISAPEGRLEDILPSLLPPLSGKSKVLLADDQGFVICSVGYADDLTSQLAAFTADMTSLLERHSALLTEHLSIGTTATGIIGAGGESRLGNWPLFIREQPFVLAIEGEPHFSADEFKQLVWLLILRYQQN